jgi:hypothetical protein
LKGFLWMSVPQTGGLPKGINVETAANFPLAFALKILILE